MDSTSFIEAVAPGAVRGWEECRILPSLSIAQAILESGWGESKLAKEAHNLFGIKAGDDWTGARYSVPTKEWDGSQYITVTAAFRAYGSWSDSVRDHAAFFSTPEWRRERYAAVIGETDYKRACEAVSQAGYATDPGYAGKLIGIIEEYNLSRYDDGGESVTQAVGSSDLYEYITSYDSPNHNGPATIDAIVVHHWGVDGQTFEGVVSWLCNPDQQAGSAHYVLEAGRVACLIAPGLRAWHVGSNDFQQVMPGISDVNAHTIGIECRPECTAGDRETLAQLIADLWHDYGRVPVYYHGQFMNTACAGRYNELIDSGWLESRAEYYYNGGVDMRPEVIEWLESLYDRVHSDELYDWEKEDLAKAVEAGITTGERPHDLPTRSETAIMVLRGKNE